MPDKVLERLLVEVNAALDDGSISPADRRLLERVRVDLEAAGRDAAGAGAGHAHVPAPKAVPAPPAAAPRSGSQLRETLSAAVERLETKHPELTSLIGKTLDALSDLGL
jgi:Domain of unknown function (DUF4404)